MKAKARTAALVAAILTATLAAPPGSAAAAIPDPPAGFRLVWGSDFTGAAGTGVDTSTWNYDTGPGSNFGTGEIETMTSSTRNVYRDGNGRLVIKAVHSGTAPRAGWTSGRINTKATFDVPAGGVLLVRASLKQPDVNRTNGAGYWPAFWMLGGSLRTGTPWPGSGEIDIMEDINGRSSVFGAFHCGTNPGGPCNESTGITSGERPCGGCQTGFHTYAVQVDRSVSPERIRWYRDGVNYFTVTANQVPAATWNQAIHHGFFIILNLAIGGGFPDAFGGGPTAATVGGRAMTVDYVAVYRRNP
ncbi:family 16 glycosylhydrolase [Actinoplanes bogorensis]|uniref:Family 16 glycosylhydrolase n=1 Tax=Paractinoplanes bogorensis TaxID=1610840 RepID=A0ABS5Z2J3_9ACTN|nr:glycoside hydrolase family 16 protein [Actinoplanes bogorensis]MBU2669914.1 family 16 glycosylhydrolase [Actinoplanes bogorensis]